MLIKVYTLIYYWLLLKMDFPIGRYYLIIAGEGGGERALRIQNTDH